MNRTATVNIQLHNLFLWKRCWEKALSYVWEEEHSDYVDDIIRFIADTIRLPGKYN